MMNGGHGWGINLWWIIGLFILAIVFLLVIKSIGRNNPLEKENEKSSLEILKDRYAKGEIDKSEFEEKKRDLLKTQ